MNPIDTQPDALTLEKLAGGHLTHEKAAKRVRMLFRDDLDHEAVCVMARDRIVYLAQREAALLAELDRLRQAQGGEAVRICRSKDVACCEVANKCDRCPEKKAAKQWAMCPETETPCSSCPTNRVPREATSPPLQADAKVPQGWKLVPVEPTPEMCAAALAASSQAINEGPEDIDTLPIAYRAMLSASPAAPTQVETQEVRQREIQKLQSWRDEIASGNAYRVGAEIESILRAAARSTPPMEPGQKGAA